MLRQYCENLKYYSSVINKHLECYQRLNPKAFYDQGPVLGYTI